MENVTSRQLLHSFKSHLPLSLSGPYLTSSASKSMVAAGFRLEIHYFFYGYPFPALEACFDLLWFTVFHVPTSFPQHVAHFPQLKVVGYPIPPPRLPHSPPRLPHSPPNRLSPNNFSGVKIPRTPDETQEPTEVSLKTSFFDIDFEVFWQKHSSMFTTRTQFLSAADNILTSSPERHHPKTYGDYELFA